MAVVARLEGSNSVRQISNLFVASLALFLSIAEPALAQSIDLSPIQSLLQGIVDALTGPLGVVIATLAVLGVFLSWFFNIIDLRQALGSSWASPALPPPPPSLPRSLPVAERAPLFLGLVRPPSFWACPSCMRWSGSSVRCSCSSGSSTSARWRGRPRIPAPWKAADWDPRFIDVMMTALQETPPTRNRSIHGGTAMPRDDARDAALDARTMTPEWYARETRLAHMLPDVSLVDDQTVRTRVNELFRCIRRSGINSYTTDDAYLDKVTALFARIVAQSRAGIQPSRPQGLQGHQTSFSTPSVRTASARWTGAGARSRPAGCATRR